jgi:hypothetical protein
VLRVAVLVALTVAGPLALASHALPQTEALARSSLLETTKGGL